MLLVLFVRVAAPVAKADTWDLRLSVYLGRCSHELLKIKEESFQGTKIASRRPTFLRTSVQAGPRLRHTVYVYSCECVCVCILLVTRRRCIRRTYTPPPSPSYTPPPSHQQVGNNLLVTRRRCIRRTVTIS
jgi:hypothetical protein